MEFGKLNNIDNIKFDLPQDDYRNSHLKHSHDASLPLKLYIGTTSWSCKQWLGYVYPKKAQATNFVRLYSEQFNSIELNTTYYGTPQIDKVIRWQSQVLKDFMFCPKLPKTISHQKNLINCREDLKDFCLSIKNFKPNLGTSFLQLPPQFGFDELPKLQAFLSLVPKNMKLSIEFRHSSWFEQGHLKEKVYQLLYNKNQAAVITDVAGRRDILHSSLTCPYAFIRFVGNELHPSDEKRLEDWLIRIKTWQNLGLKEIYFFVHQPEDILSPELISRFLPRWREELNIEIRSWNKVIEPQRVEQISLF